MIRQGSLIRVTAFADASDIRFVVVRFDHAADDYHLRTARSLHDFTMPRECLHAALRDKRLTLERKGP